MSATVIPRLAVTPEWRAYPTVRHLFVFHVGHPGADLAQRAPMRFGSYEGPGISVSLCPTAWTRIAKLGGSPVYTFSRRDHGFGQFLDMHAITPNQRHALRVIAQSAGLLTPAILATVTRDDDEFEDSLTFTYATVDEALTEAGCSVGTGPDDDLTPDALETLVARARDDMRCSTRDSSPVWEHPDSGDVIGLTQSFVATPLLEAWWHEHFTGRLHLGAAEEMAFACMAAETSHFDGLWWNDTLDPSVLSAPRGVIFPSALWGWQSRKAVRRDLARAIDEHDG